MAKKKEFLTYNSGDSPVVTHLTTSPPVRCLNRAERTGSLVFNVLWSYVRDETRSNKYNDNHLQDARYSSIYSCRVLPLSTCEIVHMRLVNRLLMLCWSEDE
jgi:hypothetical protein